MLFGFCPSAVYYKIGTDTFLYKTLISNDQSNICYRDLFSIVSNALETALEANLNDAILTNLQAPLFHRKRKKANTCKAALPFSNIIPRICKEFSAEVE